MISREDLRDVLASVLAIQPSEGEAITRSDDGPWDSVAHIEVILATEELIGVPLLEDDLHRIASLDDLLEAARRVAPVAGS